MAFFRRDGSAGLHRPHPALARNRGRESGPDMRRCGGVSRELPIGLIHRVQPVEHSGWHGARLRRAPDGRRAPQRAGWSRRGAPQFHGAAAGRIDAMGGARPLHALGPADGREGALMLYRLRRHPLPIDAFFTHSLVLTYAYPAKMLQQLLPPGLADVTYDDSCFIAIGVVVTRRMHPAVVTPQFGGDFFLI